MAEGKITKLSGALAPASLVRVRRVLAQDPGWSAYALGDLDPENRPYCDWWLWEAEDPEGGTASALVLLYRRFGTPVLFTLGGREALSPLLAAALAAEKELDLQVQPEALALLKEGWLIRKERAMWRMLLPGSVSPAVGEIVAEITTPLTMADLPALRSLYADGEGRDEAPDFFFPQMLAEGAFRGVWEAGRLVAAAGTHLVSHQERVATVGNVYVHRERRGRGLAQAVTAAVCADLRRLGMETVALNVAQDNPAALRAYERVGFTRHRPFTEGLAHRG